MFNKNGYEIRRDAIDTKTLDLVYEYHKLKVENNEFEIDTAQVTGTITMYGDTLNDAILRAEKLANKNGLENFSRYDLLYRRSYCYR